MGGIRKATDARLTACTIGGAALLYSCFESERGACRQDKAGTLYRAVNAQTATAAVLVLSLACVNLVSESMPSVKVLKLTERVL
jgi:hypothetical protein